MTNGVSREEVRRLLPSKRCQAWLPRDCQRHRAGGDRSPFMEGFISHIRGSYPDNEKIEEGFETGPIFSFLLRGQLRRCPLRHDDRRRTGGAGTEVSQIPLSDRGGIRGRTRIGPTAGRTASSPSVRMKNYCHYWVDSIARTARASRWNASLSFGTTDIRRARPAREAQLGRSLADVQLGQCCPPNSGNSSSCGPRREAVRPAVGPIRRAPSNSAAVGKPVSANFGSRTTCPSTIVVPEADIDVAVLAVRRKKSAPSPNPSSIFSLSG